MVTTQLSLPDNLGEALPAGSATHSNHSANRLASGDRAFHGWYRFVLSYPPHLVRDYCEAFQLNTSHTVLDPFCGTGTTLVEAKKNGVTAIGLEANPFAQFASAVKVDWSVDPDRLEAEAQVIARTVNDQLAAQGIPDDEPFTRLPAALVLRTLDKEAARLILANSISPLPLHKTLLLLDQLNLRHTQPFYRHMLLALANALVFQISNLRFGPEVGVGKPKTNYPVVAAWLSEIMRQAEDLRRVLGQPSPPAEVHLADARQVGELITANSIDAVITSPPYPNEKDYTRTTRLESVILGFITSKAQLRLLKQQMLRSNTRGVYKRDDDDRWVAEHPEIERIAQAIESRRIELGKDSGFERLYSKVTKLYFGGMARHLADLRRVLRPGAQLAYVVGDQASYLRVMIRTGQLLADIAQTLGYEVVRTDLFRTRFATATKEQLREEVLVLRWPGR